MNSEPLWMTPEQAGPKLGRTTREVRELCASSQIDHQRKTSPGGRVRYLLNEESIRAFLARTMVRAKPRRITQRRDWDR